MKYTAHVPVEQYGFVEVEADSLLEVTQAYNDTKKMFLSGAGALQKEFNDWFDTYRLTGKAGSADVWASMTKEQQYAINELKKSFKRVLSNDMESEVKNDKN